MTDKRLILFPETDAWMRDIYSKKFVDQCVKHVISLGYHSTIIKDQICIISPNGESSCNPGTLVGWKFVNEIEEFISKNGYPWFGDTARTREEISKGFAIVGQFANIISELIIKETTE